MLRNNKLRNTITIGEESMAEGKSTVRLKMRIGDVDFEIECNVTEVQNVVDNVLAAMTKRNIQKISTIDRSTPLQGRGGTCKSIIFNLWKESWFNTGRSLGDVHGEMGRRGYHYDRTAVAHALVDLVREGILTRIGRPRRYQYLQKRPPQTKTNEKAE